MTDDILSVRYSPNGKLLAVALLDSTVKVFYQDTLKFFLSLYGHKVDHCHYPDDNHILIIDVCDLQLPVLSMDISYDSKLIVTSSADKNVKIWGLDFGDCHKSIYAHDESVMQVAFEKKSHYFWTVGKDKLLKYWDGIKVWERQIHSCPRRLMPNDFSLKTFRDSKVTTVKFGHSLSAILLISS
jgi:U3 small nucleolar RNA-associated protein 12